MFDQLEGIILREMERGKLPGLAIALVKGREMVWAKGYGYADLEKKVPVTPSTVFRVASVTKPVVATALMQWYERGSFWLDDPANAYLAPLRIDSEFEDNGLVTFRHLLTHTSGLPMQVPAVATDPESLPTLEDFVARVAKTVRPVGDEIVYANGGYAILGYLLGRFAGKPYDVALAEQVLEPLGMRSSAIACPLEGASAATGHFVSELDGEHHAIQQVYYGCRPGTPASALFSTVEDLARFLIAHVNGGVYHGRRILGRETVAEMHRLHVAAGPSRSGMGLGFMVRYANGPHQIFHGGDTPGFVAFIGACPQEKVGVALLINLTNAFAISVVANAALQLLGGDYRRYDLADLRVEAAPEEWDRLTGRYSWIGRDLTITVEDRALVLELDGTKSYLEQLQPSLFRAHDGHFDGSELIFEHGEDGKAKRFYTGIWRADRQGEEVPAADLAVDEGADVVGRWSGTVSSPLGPIPAALDIANSATATVTALSAHEAAIDEFRAERGRVSGHFDTAAPGVGEMRVFLRLNAVAGGLRGRAYALGAFGEVPMPAEFTRE